ncbi:MAG: thiol:disulfide interchange protein DsbA/DsbL [Legionella sp.]|uniref:thiol:disulfide interchange protein DsbA/DsbL n=1 Tax=Legionella sp. TaxID=459 RepID=UPI00283D9A62|nr:thiol:disulfide interchange protein DsbA/DsbL [Legionella sp.]
MLKKLFCFFLLLPTMAFAAAFVEGKDYVVVSNTQAVKSKTPIIQEFFSYGCPWCYKIEAPLHQWVSTLGKGVQFERVPVVFKPSWELYAKAYYTAKTLALSDRLNPVLFKAIQVDRTPLESKQTMINFFVSQGVDREIAKSAFENSPTIDMKVQTGMSLMGAYQISAVPAFVVNQKYKTDLQLAGSPERLMEILNYLAKKSA